MNIFHENLKNALKKAKLSQRQLAFRLNVKPQSLWEWCNISYPSVERLLEICYTLKITPNELLGFDDDIKL